jgi:C4-dicarboxylate-specific signal transduction histidine kinase
LAAIVSLPTNPEARRIRKAARDVEKKIAKGLPLSPADEQALREYETYRALTPQSDPRVPVRDESQAELLVRYRVEKTKAEADLKRKQLERADLELQILRGEYVSRALIREEATRIASVLSSALFAACDDMPGLLVGLDEVAIRRKMATTFDAMLASVRRQLEEGVVEVAKKTAKAMKAERAKERQQAEEGDEDESDG